MKNNLAERLNRVLLQDKSSEPNRILPALRADLRDLLREYAEFNKELTIAVNENVVEISRPNDLKVIKSLHGTTNALIKNMIIGVSEGYKKELELVQNQNIDISHFEENMNAFKEGFGRNYRLASEKFKKAIAILRKV